MDNVTSEDITMFQQMAFKLANILVQASDIGQQVPALRSEIDALKSDCESIRWRNMELDEELYAVRNQRDQAKADYDSVYRDLTLVREELSNATASMSRDAEAMNTLRQDLSLARNDRDNACYRNLELEEQLKTANAVIAKFKEFLGGMTGPISEPITPPTPDAVPVPISEGEAIPLPAPEPQHETPNPSARRIYNGEEGFSWRQANLWDDIRREWYMEVRAA